jgi:hypothetical protein
MKKQFIIIFLLFAGLKIEANPCDTVKVFDLTICESYGCVASVNTFINFHYEEDKLSITFSKGYNNLINKEFDRRIFCQFYDSLFFFNFQNLSSRYKVKHSSSATGDGTMSISVNKKLVKSVYFMTQPDDSTNFMFLHRWIYNKASSLVSSSITLKNLLSTKFYLIDCISDYAALHAVQYNTANINIDDILLTIDTTKNTRLGNVMISSLVYYKDNRIIAILGEKILKKINKKDSMYCYPCTMRELTPFLEQDSCARKIYYLKLFLNSKSHTIRLESSIALAYYGFTDGEKFIIDDFNVLIINHKEYKDFSELAALVKIGDKFVLDDLINNYKKMKSKKDINDFADRRNLANIIIAINAILDKKKVARFDEFEANDYNFWRKKIDEEIVKLDNRIRLLGIN